MKKIIRISVIVLILLLIGYLFLPYHTQQALVHLTANIDDYEIFENRRIPASNPKEWKLSEHYNQIELGNNSKETLEKYETTAYLIIKDSSILYESYYDDGSKETISNSFSAAKSIISLLIGIAIEENKINSVFQPVADFIPTFNTRELNTITIRDLLGMSSGLKWDEAYMNPFSETTKAYYGNDLNSLIESLEKEEASGEQFEYKSIDTQVLAAVLENAVGLSVSEYASSRLWRKIGATTDALWSLDAAGGSEKAFCCFNATARDFAKIGQLILQNGQWEGEQVVPMDYIEMATKPFNYINSGETAPFYGYQWWILQYEGQSIPYARGILGQYIFVLKNQNAVVVRLGKSRSRIYEDRHPEDVYEYVKIAYSVINNKQLMQK